MSVQLKSRFPGGNGRFLGLETSGSEPELFFAPESHGGAEALWFNVRLEDQAPTAPLPQQLRITIPYADTLVGAGELHALRPAYHPEGKGWFRASAGAVAVTPDGRQAITWTIPYPELPTQFALCYPYGRRELKGLIDKSKGYWRAAELGLSGAGNPLPRLSNNDGSMGSTKPPGLYLAARLHGGETPASWVLDGMLRLFARAKRNPLTIWVAPLGDLDGVESGSYASKSGVPDLKHGWGVPPARHEALLLQQDLKRWCKRTTPLLALELGAVYGGDGSDGAVAQLPAGCPDALGKSTTAWCNVLRDALSPDYAATPFMADAAATADPADRGFTEFATQALEVPAISLAVSYALSGTQILTQKRYREMGEALAEAILRRATH
jgi:hypothetical protein